MITKIILQAPSPYTSLVSHFYFSAADRKKAAIHEAGHVIATTYSASNLEIIKASIQAESLNIYSNGINGAVSFETEKKPDISCLTMVFGGMAAEEAVYGYADTGCESDGEIARIIAIEGLSGTSVDELLYTGLFGKTYLDEDVLPKNQTSGEFCEAVQNIQSKALNETRKIISERKIELHKIENALLEKGTLTGQEINTILEIN